MLAQIPFRVPPVFHLRDTCVGFFSLFLQRRRCRHYHKLLLLSHVRAHNKQQLPGSEVQTARSEETLRHCEAQLHGLFIIFRQRGRHEVQEMIKFQQSCSDKISQKTVRPSRLSSCWSTTLLIVSLCHCYTAFAHK